ncbi:MAG: hypothetical protein WDN69_04665 [Aliidongia sp.]
MLRGLVGTLEKHHKVRILDEALVEAVRLSHRYIPAPAIARQSGQPARHRLRPRRHEPDLDPGRRGGSAPVDRAGRLDPGNPAPRDGDRRHA